MVQAFSAIQLKVPIWKVLAGILLEPQKIRLLANFGAATPKLKAATRQGDLAKVCSLLVNLKA